MRRFAQGVFTGSYPASTIDHLGRRVGMSAAVQSARDIAGGVGRVLPGDKYSGRYAGGFTQSLEQIANFGAQRVVPGLVQSFRLPSTGSVGQVVNAEGFSGGTVLDVLTTNQGWTR